MIGRASARVALVLALAACGGGSQLPLGGPSGVDAGDADSPLAVSPCPTTVPASGSACTLSSSIACEIGSDVDGACNSSAVCSSGAWSIGSPSGSATTCPTPVAILPCPLTYDTVQIGSECSSPDLTCGYAEGWCLCTGAVSGPAQPAGHYEWQCDRPATGCPTPRPHLGTTCTVEGESCNYGSCTLPQGVVEQCTDGLWEPVPAACPDSRFP